MGGLGSFEWSEFLGVAGEDVWRGWGCFWVCWAYLGVFGEVVWRCFGGFGLVVGGELMVD